MKFTNISEKIKEAEGGQGCVTRITRNLPYILNKIVPLSFSIYQKSFPEREILMFIIFFDGKIMSQIKTW